MPTAIDSFLRGSDLTPRKHGWPARCFFAVAMPRVKIQRLQAIALDQLDTVTGGVGSGPPTYQPKRLETVHAATPTWSWGKLAQPK